MAIKPLADAFLRMIKMIIAPLLFSTLVVGIAGTGDMKAMGRIGLKALIYFEVATTIALFLGLGLVNWFQPGAGVSVAGTATPTSRRWRHASSRSPRSSCTSSRRRSSTPWPAATSSRSSSSRPSSAWRWPASARRGVRSSSSSKSVAQVMFRFTAYVMKFAPLGVMAAMAATVGGRGLGILLTLGKLVGVMYLGLRSSCSS